VQAKTCNRGKVMLYLLGHSAHSSARNQLLAALRAATLCRNAAKICLKLQEGWKCQVRTAQTEKSKKGRREVRRNMVGKQASMKPGLSFQILP
jgi:hypothetical protein